MQGQSLPNKFPLKSNKPIIKQECIIVGCVPHACCPYLQACTATKGVCTWSGGVPGPRGCLPSLLLPPVNRMTNRCNNITLPQSIFAAAN